MRIIGDIHGDYAAYLEIISGAEKSIQVGDFGIGFSEDDFKRSSSHRFIRGNHDDPHECKKNSHWIPDGSKFENIFCVGGGFSIDRDYRVEGVSWWPEEELSHQELYKVMDLYETLKPKIVVSHEAPSSVIPRMFYEKNIFPPSRTSMALDSMLYIHKPKLWFFGHWHENRTINIDGTTFICLGVNSYIDLK